MLSAAQLFSGDSFTPSADALADALRCHYNIDQRTYLEPLLPHVSHDASDEAVTRDRCINWLNQLRRHPPEGLAVAALLREFPLARADGVALMSLAEALLRIPDSACADAFIRDRLSRADWDHGGDGNPWLDAAHRGLTLAQHLLTEPHASSLDALLQQLGQPLLRQALKRAIAMISEQFVIGETIYEGLDRSQSLLANGDSLSFDMLGEAALCAEDAQRYFDAYQSALLAVSRSESYPDNCLRPSLSVKLSALHPRFEWRHRRLWLPIIEERMRALINLGRDHDIAITLDAEESDRLESTLLLFERLLQGPAKEWGKLGIAVQAYSRRALITLAWLTHRARTEQTVIPLRLVKGAYWDSEIKWAQQRGLKDYPVFTNKPVTDIHYLACARYLFSAATRNWIYPQFATHNARTLADILTLSDDRPFECQRLYGMGEELYNLAREKRSFPCRVYAPVGPYRNLLPYLVRRLLENGANSSFVNQIHQASADLEGLAAPPVSTWKGTDEFIVRPPTLFEPRRANSRGVNLHLKATENHFAQLLAESAPYRRAAPLIDGTPQLTGESEALYSPQDRDTIIGEYYSTSPDIAIRALQQVTQGALHWGQLSPSVRSECLLQLATLLEAQRDELVQLLVVEAGKTVSSALDEIREAVDFCYYYADQALTLFNEQALPGPTGEENRLRMEPRGVFLCISPWNFPLAIFIGQVAAALVTGNGVLAKPARQTSLIAQRAVELLLEAGVPSSAVALLPGPSQHFCETLLADSRLSGVAFTGSTDSAHQIQQQLASRPSAPIVPLIAETGGQNAMIVDSSALPEQVVKDVLEGAFGAAGQRCSALRLLCLQAEIADEIEQLLIAALKEQVVGNPAQLDTDIGPVIDDNACQQLEAYISEQQQTQRLIYRLPLPDNLDAGRYVAPALIRLKDANELGSEQFGPILHLLRFKYAESNALMDAINGLGYGLTLSIHSRNHQYSQQLANRARVGNIYINRHQTGAVVGSQPFGGCGLSGTGPKAGGPNYLQRFVYEKHISTNTSAWGGNATLLSR